MWSDNETDRDLLNFQGVADTVAEFILQADGTPISVGVSGAWGVGKSTMIRLTRAALDEKRPAKDPTEFVFVEFNAWLYQGYDDARAALLDVIAAELDTIAEERQTGTDKVKEFLRRVRWLRLAKLVALPAAAMAGYVNSMWPRKDGLIWPHMVGSLSRCGTPVQAGLVARVGGFCRPGRLVATGV